MNRWFKTILFLAIFSAGLAWSESGVTFYAGFEGTADAVIAAGEKTGDTGGKTARYEAGKRGKALKAGDGEPFVKYQGENNIALPEGSIEMWVMPVNWSIPKWGFHIFFRADGKNNEAMMLYKFGHYGGRVIMYLAGKSIGTPVSSTEPSMHRWTQGQWRHVVGVWSKQDVRLYVDGQRIKPAALEKPFSAEIGSFQIGDDPWASAAKGSKIPEWEDTAENRNAHTLIDEVYLYNRALTDEEVEWAFENWEKRIPGSDVPLNVTEVITSLSVLPHIKEKKMHVVVQTNPRRIPEGAVCSVALKGPEDISVSEKAELTGENTWETSLPVHLFPKGDFMFTAEIRDEEGNLLGTRETSILSPGPPVWEGNSIGITATPPPPYVPLKLLPGNEGFTCWNRTVVLDKAGFLKQVTSAGIPLLSAPMTLAGTVNGKQIVWKPASLKLVEADNNRVIWESISSSTLGELTTVITGEYDGMVRYDFTLVPGISSATECLELRLPVRKQVVTSSISSTARIDDPMQVRHGTFDDLSALQKITSTPRILHKPWVLYMWLGNNEAGISGVAESDEAWDEAGRTDAFRLEETDDGITMVWSFSKRKRALSNPWKFTIGIQVTPVKNPEPARKWRYTAVSSWSPKIRFHPLNGNFNILWTSPSLNLHYGYPQAKNEESFRKWVQENMNSQGVACAPYSLLTNFSTDSPEYKFYFHSLAEGREGGGGDISAFGSSSAITRMALVPSCIDFLVWKNSEYVRTIGFSGLYHDLCTPYPLTKGRFGYERDGERRPTYPVFALRSLHRRIYTMLKTMEAETGRDFLSVNHQTSYAWLGAYCDLAWVGEAVKEDYRRSLSPEKMQELNTNKLGYRTLWLPQPSATGINKYFSGRSMPEQPTRYLTGMLLLHDMDVTATYCNIKVLADMFSAIDRFGGIADTTFFPYWKKKGVTASPGDAGVLCSAYVKPLAGNGSLLCAVNMTDKSQKSRLTLDFKLLNAGGKPAAKDLLTGEATDLDGNVLEVNLAPYDYALIEVK